MRNVIHFKKSNRHEKCFINEGKLDYLIQKLESLVTCFYETKASCRKLENKIENDVRRTKQRKIIIQIVDVILLA